MENLTYEDAENLYNTYSELMKSPDMLIEFSKSKWTTIKDTYVQAKKETERYKALMEELRPKA